jgi:hypothetical protein
MERCIGVLEDHLHHSSHLFSLGFMRVETGDANAAGPVRIEAHDGAEDGGLARAGLAHEPETATFMNDK